MKNTPTIDQIQYLFTFPFEDEGWKQKFLIAFLLSVAGFFIPIIPWIFIAGYTAKIIEVVIKEDQYHLPEWDDWGNFFMDGLRLVALGFIAVLPFLLLMGLAYAFMFAPIFIGEDTFFGNDIFTPWVFTSMLGMFASMFIIGFAVFFFVLLGVFFPAAMTHMIAEDTFSAAFRIKEWWPIFKTNLWGYVISFILLLGTTYLMMFAFQLFYMTIILCCLIPFISSVLSVYISIFTGAVFGQTYRVGREKSELGSGADEEEEN